MTPRSEALLFLAAASIPAVVMGGLGLRALRNEEAALRREAALEVAAAAERAGRRATDELEAATAALAKVRLAGAVDDAAARDAALAEVRRLAPAFAEPVAIGEGGALLAPRGAAPARDDARCDDAARALGGADHAQGARAILDGCPEARDAAGRWLYPVVAIASLDGRDDVALASRLVGWLEEHGARMSPAERVATRSEVGRALRDEALRARAMAVLARPGGASGSLVGTLARTARAEAVTGALREPTERVVAVRGADAVGALRAMPGGGWVGWMATVETLSPTLHARTGPFGELPPGLEAIAVRVASPSTPDAPSAVGWLAPELGVEVRLRDPALVAARAARSEWILAALAASGIALALGLSLLLYARVRAARRTSELRTSFVAAVSHELRTPIASLRMLSELLAEDRVDGDDERREVASALAREARRMGETVDRLLSYARLEKDRLVAMREHARLSPIVAERVEVFRERHPELGVELELDPDLEAAVDRAQLELVVDNLLENAAKFAPKGGPYRVALRRDGDALELSVSDRGPGVPAHLERRIFEAFERGDDRLSRATSGTGLGLAHVRAVARAHGGAASVRTTPGGGATFVVRLASAATREGRKEAT